MGFCLVVTKVLLLLLPLLSADEKARSKMGEREKLGVRYFCRPPLLTHHRKSLEATLISLQTINQQHAASNVTVIMNVQY